MIGIIGAMDEEVEQLVEVMEITREETKQESLPGKMLLL